MTRIFMDNREIEPPNDCSSISRILKHVDEAHLAANTVVRQIQVNGCPLMSNYFSRIGKCVTPGGIEDLDRVEIFTGNIAEMVCGSISEAFSDLERIESLTPLLSERVRKDPSPASFSDLRQLYEAVDWMDLLMDKLKADFPVHPSVHSEDVEIRKCFKPERRRNFVAALQQVKESEVKGDFVRVSDQLEREALALVPLWRKMLMATSQRVGRVQ